MTTIQKDCFICGEEGSKKDRFVGTYTLCSKKQCETDLDNHLQKEKDEEDGGPLCFICKKTTATVRVGTFLICSRKQCKEDLEGHVAFMSRESCWNDPDWNHKARKEDPHN
jgi:hypothetical protein